MRDHSPLDRSPFRAISSKYIVPQMVQDGHSVLWRCATGSAQDRLYDLVRAHFLPRIFADHILHEGANDVTRTSARECSSLLSMCCPCCLPRRYNIRKISG